MKPDVRVDALLERLLVEAPTSRAPDRLRHDIASATSHQRQRPPWLATLREPPMRYRSRLAVGSPTLRLAAVIAASVALLATVAGAAVGGASLFEAKLPPITGPAGNGLIAFSRDGDIYLGDPVTGESRAIVAVPEMDTDPVFSPDGTRIAFWRTNRPADDDDHGDHEIVVVRADGSDERVPRLPDGPFGRSGGDFVWVPGSRLLALSQVVGVPGPRFGLFVLDATGVAEARSPALPGYNLAGDQVAWFVRPPSGDRILVSDWGVDPILGVRDLDGGDVLGLAELSELDEARRRGASGASDLRFVGIWDEAWSPDAARIVFVASAGPDPYFDHLFIIDEDGSDLRILAEQGGNMAWSPDSSTVAFTRDRIEPGSTEWCPGEWSIDDEDCASAEWITPIDVDSGAVRELEASRLPDPDLADLTRDGPAIGGWSWSPDGRSILAWPGPGTRPLVIDVASDTATELPWESDSVPSWQRVAAD